MIVRRASDHYVWGVGGSEQLIPPLNYILDISREEVAPGWIRGKLYYYEVEEAGIDRTGEMHMS